MHVYTPAELALRWVERHRARVGVAVLAIMSAIGVWAVADARAATLRRRAAEGRVVEASLLAQNPASLADAVSLVLETFQRSAPETVEGQRTLHAVATSGPLSWPLKAHVSNSWLHAWSLDSSSLFSVDRVGRIAAWSREGQLRWVSTERVENPSRLVRSADGSVFAVTTNRSVALFTRAGSELRLLRHRLFDHDIGPHFLSANGETLCVGLVDGSLTCLVGAADEFSLRLGSPALAFAANDQLAVTAGEIVRFDRGGVVTRRALARAGATQGLLRVVNGPVIVTSGDGATLLDPETLEARGELELGSASARAVTQSPDGRWVAIASGGAVLLFEVAALVDGARPDRVLGAPGGSVEFRNWNPFVRSFGVLVPVLADGLSGQLDERADQRVLELESGVEFARLAVPGGSGYEAVTSPDGERVLTCSSSQCRVWRFDPNPAGGPVARFEGPLVSMESLSDGGWTATAASGQWCSGTRCGRAKVGTEVTAARSEWLGLAGGAVFDRAGRTVLDAGFAVVAIDSRRSLLHADVSGRVTLGEVTFELDAGVVDARWLTEDEAVVVRTDSRLDRLSVDGGVRSETVEGRPGRLELLSTCVAVSAVTQTGWHTQCGRNSFAGLLLEWGGSSGLWLFTTLPGSTLGAYDVSGGATWHATVPGGIGPVVSADVRAGEVRALTRNGVLAFFALDGGSFLGAQRTPAVDRAQFSADGAELLVSTPDGLVWRAPLRFDRQVAWLCQQTSCLDGGLR